MSDLTYVFTALDGTVTKMKVTDDTIHIANRLDVEPLLDGNAELRNSAPGLPRNKDQFHHIARLDNLTYYSLRRQGILDDPKRFKKWLNDRDFNKFRVSEAKV
jgi:hypothetical protein